MDSVDDVEAGEDPQHMRLKEIPCNKKRKISFSFLVFFRQGRTLRLKEIPAASASVFVLLY